MPDLHVVALSGGKDSTAMALRLRELNPEFEYVYICTPNWRQRWCTRMLKIEPYAAWLMQQSDKYDRVVSYVGIRADKQGVVSSETPSDYTQNYLCKADYTQSVDVEAIAEIYEREREKYLGGTGDYYPNNKAAFEGCMQKALSQSGLLGGWRDIESLEEKDGEVLLSGHEFNKESKPRWYATGFKNIVGEVLAYDEDGASNASYADKWMPIPPAKEGGC